MPTYLVHGFRWERPQIRIHIILNGLDDAAAEWLMAPRTSAAFKRNFREKFPEAMNALPKLRFIEQYDPNDETGSITDYAYVADFVHEVKLDADIEAVRGKGVPEEQWQGILALRDKLAPLQKVAWYIVVCGDEERSYPKVETPVKRSKTTVAGMKTTLAGDVKPAANHGRPASRGSHVKDGAKAEAEKAAERAEKIAKFEKFERAAQAEKIEKAAQAERAEKAEKAEKAKRSNSFTRSIRKYFTSKEPKDPKDSKEQADRGREVRKSRSLRSIRSLAGLRNKEHFNSERNSPERQPPLPGTAK